MERKTPRFKKSHVNYSELLHLARAGVIFVSWSFETALIFGAYEQKNALDLLLSILTYSSYSIFPILFYYPHFSLLSPVL